MEKIYKELEEYQGKYFSGSWPTITQMFNISLTKFPNRDCLVFYDPKRVSYTYKEVRDLVKKAASVLIEKGVKKGDKVALNGKNSIQWAIGYFAINYAGAVVVPIDNQLSSKKTQELANFADAIYLLADSDVINKLDKEDPWFKNLYGIMSLKDNTKTYDNIMETKSTKLYDEVEICEDDLAAILFTSGTTGNEKGTMLTNKNIVSNVYLAAEWMPVTENDVFYALLPLHHSYCCTTVLLETVKNGAQCLFGHGIIVSKMIADMKLGKVTIFMGIPLLFNKILSRIMKNIKSKGAFTYGFIKTLMFINGWFKKYLNKSPFSSFFKKKILSNLGLDNNNFLICGAGPLAPEVFKQFQQMGLDFLQGYGLTETSPVLTLNPREKFKIDSVGKVLSMMDIIIADKNASGIGEIRVKGPNVTPGYYKDIENTKALFDENGYLKTGDLGTKDNDNYVYIKGRAKNIIVTEGGKNVYPEEIEDAFQTYSQVEQIMVRGFQAKKGVPSECIEAVIYPSNEYYKEFTKEKMVEDINELVQTVNRELTSYKKIEKITILEEAMEMTTTKKIKRTQVK